MSEGKRKREGGKDKSRRRYHYDGRPIRQTIDGPSVWVTCVRGKEKQAIGELYDLFEPLAAEMWPEDGDAGPEKDSDSDDDDDGDIEKQIAKEMSSIKRPRKETRFASCRTDTSCFVVISCKSPIDPIQLVIRHVENIVKSGVTKTRYAQRLSPVSSTCVTNLQEVKALCTRLLEPLLAEDKTFTYKIELRMRNHNTLTRPVIVQELANCVPKTCKVDLVDPEVFILVEIFKSTCGIGIVRDYYRLQKFNVMEIAKAEEPGFKQGEGRLAGKSEEKVEKQLEETIDDSKAT